MSVLRSFCLSVISFIVAPVVVVCLLSIVFMTRIGIVNADGGKMYNILDNEWIILLALFLIGFVVGWVMGVLYGKTLNEDDEKFWEEKGFKSSRKKIKKRR